MSTRASLTRSQASLGGMASLLKTVAYVVAVLALMVMPLDTITDNTSGFVAYYSATPLPIDTLSAALIVLAMLGIMAVVPTTAVLLDEARHAWVTAGKNIMLLSLAVIAVYYCWFLSEIPSFVTAGCPVST